MEEIQSVNALLFTAVGTLAAVVMAFWGLHIKQAKRDQQLLEEYKEQVKQAGILEKQRFDEYSNLLKSQNEKERENLRQFRQEAAQSLKEEKERFERYVSILEQHNEKESKLHAETRQMNVEANEKILKLSAENSEIRGKISAIEQLSQSVLKEIRETTKRN